MTQFLKLRNGDFVARAAIRRIGCIEQRQEDWVHPVYDKDGDRLGYAYPAAVTAVTGGNYHDLPAVDLARLIGRALDGDFGDRKELAKALADTGLGDDDRLHYLADLVERFQNDPNRNA